MTDTPELNVWREASDAASENAVKWKPAAEDRAAAVIRTYGDQRDADAYQRGKTEGARLAIEAAAGRAYAKCAETRHVTLGDACRQAIRALSPAKIVGEG